MWLHYTIHSFTSFHIHFVYFYHNDLESCDITRPKAGWLGRHSVASFAEHVGLSVVSY